MPPIIPASSEPATQSHSHFGFSESDVIRLILEYLTNRDLNISQISLERESGVSNCCHFSDDLLFLRQLILDGQWLDVIQFVTPLEKIDSFDAKKFRFLIYRAKFIELLFVRGEAGGYQNVEIAVEEVVLCLNHLQKDCPSKDEYNELCLLLTLPNLAEHEDFKMWNPSSWRQKCFNAILPLVEKFLPPVKKSQSHSNADITQKTSRGDRLMQLIIKGILYESCVNYCQSRATAGTSNQAELRYSSLLEGVGFSNSDLSLISWLQALPESTFEFPFDQKKLNVDVEQLDKPSLVASWSEMMLITPIKPKVFPHDKTPFTRMKPTDLLSKSLTSGLVDGLSRSVMAFSVNDVAAMSRSSFAATGFHLNDSNSSGNINSGKKSSSQASVDRLFEEGDVFQSSCFETLPTIPEKVSSSPLVGDKENSKLLSKQDEVIPNNSMIDHNQSHEQKPLISTPKSVNNSQNKHSILDTPDLWQKFQREKQKLMQKLIIEEEEVIDNVIDLRNNYKTPPMGQQQAANNNIVISNENVTPVSQTGQINFPNPERLTTSTPKGGGNPASRIKEVANFSPHQSPIFPASHTQNGILSAIQQRNLSFNDSGNTTISANQSSVRQQTSTSTANSSQNHIAHSNVNQRHGPNTSFRSNISGSSDLSVRKPQFVPLTTLEDAQAIRAAEFHPSGQIYAIGSNSKTLRICGYPKAHELRALREDHEPHQPNVITKHMKHHKGSIYCLSWNPTGDLLATGSNDKTIKLMRFNEQKCEIEGGEAELTMHDGTVRDLCFMEDTSNRSSLLISGGAGDCKIYITDCETATPFQALSGHSGHILSLYTWGGAMFVSGSQDRTIRFWDLRTRGCTNIVTAPPMSGSGPGSAAAAVTVDPSGKLLVSGHEDANCMLYDIRGGRIIQTFRPHTSDIRTIRFSPKAYYLLSGGYDNKIVLTDLQGDLTQPLPSVVVAEHNDKVIQARWHPNDFTFLTTSADRTATLWALPN